MRVIVCGGRDYDDRKAVIKALLGLPRGTTVVHGGCSGADKLAESVWESWSGVCEVHPADWDKHGKAAGPLRNQHMVDLGAKYCIAFPGGKGMADCVARAEKAKIQVKRVK